MFLNFFSSRSRQKGSPQTRAGRAPQGRLGMGEAVPPCWGREGCGVPTGVRGYALDSDLSALEEH